MASWLRVLACASAVGALGIHDVRPITADARATPMFRDVTAEAGIRFTQERAAFDPVLTKVMTWVTSIHAGGCAADYDNDGDVDFYVLTSKQGAPNALFRNDGGVFVDVAASSGVADLNNGDSLSMACLFADADNDGDQDLFTASYGRNLLLWNDGAGHFTEGGVAAGLRDIGNSSAGLWLDYDADGWLDLMVGRYFPKDMRRVTTTVVFPTTYEGARNGASNLLYHNNGNGTFTEVARALGVDDAGWTLALGAGDLDDDGDLDVYVANDFGPDVVYRNNADRSTADRNTGDGTSGDRTVGDGAFTDVTREAIGIDKDAGMNVDMGDFDNDGRLDIYVTNITNPVFDQGNMLWQNFGGLLFANVARELTVWDGGWGWSGKFLDFDNDGDLDIYTVNGFVSDGPIDLFRGSGQIYRGNVSDLRSWPDMRGMSLSGHEHKRLFRNDGETFAEIAAAASLDSLADSRGIVLADIDGDGDQDLLVTNVAASPTLYRNEIGQQRSWLEAELAGTVGNRDAIGARLTASTGNRRQIREVDGGNGYCGQSSRVVHFGLADADVVDQLEIRWPGGRRVRYRDLPARARVVIQEEGSR